jgi:signal transduction histidine kinase/DNA-binding response OmpR family regulator
MTHLLPVTIPLIALMTTQSLIFYLPAFVLHIIMLLFYSRLQTIDYMISISHDRERVTEAINVQVTYSIDCAFVVLISMLTQIYSSRQAILQLFAEKDKLCNMKDKNLEVTEELKRTMKGKDEFLLSVSHELRNPLNILLGNLELSQMNSKDNSEDKYLNNAKISGELLAFLINNLLDAGKLQTKNLEVSTTPTNVQSFTDRIWSISKMMFQRKNLHGQLYLSKEIPKTLHMDPHRVMQIIINLVGNATKFTMQGGVTIIISWIQQQQLDSYLLNKNISDEFSLGLNHINRENSERTISLGEAQDDEVILNSLEEYNSKPKFKSMADANSKKKFYKIDFNTQTIPEPISSTKIEKALEPTPGFLKIEVRDTGCGIDDNVIPKLFSKFSQVSHDSKQQQLGTGLGLWIVQNLCTSMGGGVRPHSIKNVGSSFVAAIRCNAIPKPPDRLPLNLSKPLRALVVDDMKSNADIHKYFLTKCDVQVPDIAYNGIEAVDLYRKRGNGFYDIIFMDRNMPLLDGDKASQMIRSHEQFNGWKSTTLAIITGHGKEEDHEGLLDPKGAIKADFVFMKPFNFQACQNLVNTITFKTCQTLDNRKMKFTKKILVVDDDNFQVQILTEYLSKMNVQVLSCFNGKEAMDTFTQCRQEIGLIFMDCEMPIMNGYETTKCLKSYCLVNQVSCPQIIGLTGHADADSKNKCLKAGMDKVETKPISFARLQNILLDHSKYN